MAGALTPVPGGVGPLTIAMLMFNTVKAAKMRRGSRVPELQRRKIFHRRGRLCAVNTFN